MWKWTNIYFFKKNIHAYGSEQQCVQNLWSKKILSLISQIIYEAYVVYLNNCATGNDNASIYSYIILSLLQKILYYYKKMKWKIFSVKNLITKYFAYKIIQHTI